jgi:hypothetical protein
MAECPICGSKDCRPIPQVGRLARWQGGPGLEHPDPDTEVMPYQPKRRRKKMEKEGV